MKNRKLAGYWLSVILSVTLWSGCDMHMIPLPQDLVPRGIIPEEISEEAREELERSGRFLKLINMPAHTQLSNIAAVSVANAVEDIAVLNPREPVKIFRDAQADNLSVYLPLIYTDSSEFIETGNFYVAFAIHVDAVTNYVTGVSDKTLALFEDGRATLDVRMLAEDSAAGGVIISPEEQEELEKAGHFLKIINMPANTQISNIFAVTIGNSVASIAGKDTREPARIFYTTDSSTLYIPLRNNNDSDFIENGNFYVAFSIHVDALISYTVTFEDTITVMFRDGRGTLDSTTLPSNDTDGPVITPEEKEELEKSGHFLKLINVPFHTQASNVISTAIANAHTTVADIHPAGTIKIFRDAHAATVYIPLCYYNDTPFFQPVDFNETGAFYVAFELYIDAVTEYIVTVSDDVLVTFRDGRGELDVRTLLGAGDPAVPDHRYLSITGLPSNVQSKNISEIFIYDQSGEIARYEDYQLILADNFSNSATIHIPLRYIGANAVFSDTGAYFVSFDLNIDALHRITVTEADKIIVQFNQGNGELNINSLPKPAEPDHRYLTISGLPANIRADNVANVFTYNQSGPIARCEDYQLVSVENSTSLRIPLSFISNGSAFTGSGGFFVSFDINIDALHKISVTKDDKIVVTFNQGNGTLDVNTLPEPEAPAEIPYLTITGLSVNTAKGGFSGVFLYNAVDKVAVCPDYNAIIITKNTGSVTAAIPLVFANNENDYFSLSGDFIVSFTLNVDAFTWIIKTRDDTMLLKVTGGSGVINMFNDRGYFAGGLVNPTDTAAPVIKKGTSFEMNLSYFEVKADTPIVQTMPLSNSALVYIYAAPAIGGFQFEYSTAAPEYNGTKRGYYLDNKRALYKFVFVKNTNDLYAVKTKIDDPWPALAATTLDNREDIFKNTLPVQFELSGAGNPQQRTITLPEGAYILVLRGAGGGNGWLGANGGSGGFISEMILVSNQTSARCFTGSGGTQGAAGAAPGGGGSGTSVIIPDTYLLCAGGGGGSNASDSTKDHAAGLGGDGGSAGPGDSGSNGESYTTSYTDTWNGNQEPPAGWYAEHTHTTVYPGGKGGGNGSASSFPATTSNAHGQGGGTAAAVSGGNNRDKLRGGGGTGGTFTTASGAGSLVIYRIF